MKSLKLKNFGAGLNETAGRPIVKHIERIGAGRNTSDSVYTKKSTFFFNFICTVYDTL